MALLVIRRASPSIVRFDQLCPASPGAISAGCGQQALVDHGGSFDREALNTCKLMFFK